MMQYGSVLARMDAAHVDVLRRGDAVGVVQQRAARRLVDVQDRRLVSRYTSARFCSVVSTFSQRFDCGAPVTKVPRPRCGDTSPSRVSRSTAWRTVTRATSNSSPSSSSDGSLLAFLPHALDDALAEQVGQLDVQRHLRVVEDHATTFAGAGRGAAPVASSRISAAPLLADHDRRRIGVGRHDARHHRRVDHAQPVDAAHAQPLVDHRARRRRPCGRCWSGGTRCRPWRAQRLPAPPAWPRRCPAGIRRR